jgi:hypothetical protein
VSSDITLRAYLDTFRLTLRQMSDGKTTFGLSAVNDGVARESA